MAIDLASLFPNFPANEVDPSGNSTPALSPDQLATTPGVQQNTYFAPAADTQNYPLAMAPPSADGATVAPSSAPARSRSRSPSFRDVYGSVFDPGGLFSPEVAFPMAGAWLSGNFGDAAAKVGAIAGQALGNQRKRQAINQLLGGTDYANLDPQTKAYLQANPDVANQLIAYNIMPRPPIFQAPGTTGYQYNPATHQYELMGGGNARGGGSNYDVEQAQKTYDSEFGTGANVLPDAPPFSSWYRSGWPIFGTPQYEQLFHPQSGDGRGAGGAATAATSQLPGIPVSQQPAPATVQQLQTALAGGGRGTGAGVAQPATPTAAPATAAPATQTGAGGLPRRGMSETALSRQQSTINAIQSTFTDLASYKAVTNAAPALDRIKAAINNPGAVSQQDLVDAMTQLSKGGGNITEAQIKLIDENQGILDRASSWLDRNLPGGPGGFLGDQSKQQLLTLANEVYNQYQKAYRPIYDAAGKAFDNAGIPRRLMRLPSPDLIEQLSGGGSAGSGTPMKPGTYNWDPNKGLVPQL
jgi:hypothetical protein